MFSATRTSREVGTLQVGHGRYLLRRVGGGRELWMGERSKTCAKLFSETKCSTNSLAVSYVSIFGADGVLFLTRCQ